MGIDPSQLSDKQRSMIAPEDRHKLGQRLETHAEAQSRADDRAEKELQDQVIGLLRRNGVEPIINRFGKKTTTNLGCPDVLFAVMSVHLAFQHIPIKVAHAIGFEFKVGTNKQSDDQIEMEKRMTTKPNAWEYVIIRSYQDALDFLRKVGIIVL